MAALAYATLGGVKRRLGITDTTDDEVLTDIIADVNLDVEDITGRQVGPTTVTDELIDGYDALENGMCLPYPKGIRTVTKLELATGTGDDFATVPDTDYFVRPSSRTRQPDWPGFEIWLTDNPSTSNSTATVFLPGFENVRLKADTGWAAIPSTLTSAAETTAARTFHARMGGYEGSDEFGERDYRAFWRGNDIRTVQRYKRKDVEII